MLLLMGLSCHKFVGGPTMSDFENLGSVVFMIQTNGYLEHKNYGEIGNAVYKSEPKHKIMN